MSSYTTVFKLFSTLTALTAMGLAGAVEIVSPTTSWTSPACVEATSTSTVSIQGGTATALGGGRWYRNVPLTLGGATSVTATDLVGRASTSVTWQAINLAAPSLPQISVRVGDALLLTVGKTGATVVKPSGVSATLAAGTQALTVWEFGGYQIQVAGQPVLAINVLSVGFDPSSIANRYLALQRSQDVTFALPAGGTFAGLAIGTGATSTQLVVTKVDDQHLKLRSNTIGRYPLWMRVGSDTGAVLLALPVQSYTLSGVREDAVPNHHPGTTLTSYLPTSAYAKTLPPAELKVTVRLTPLLPDLLVAVTRFAHGATFTGGVSKFTVATDGSPSSLGEKGFVSKVVSGQTLGEFTYTVFKPQNEVSTCVKLVASQPLPVFVPITSTSIN